MIEFGGQHGVGTKVNTTVLIHLKMFEVVSYVCFFVLLFGFFFKHIHTKNVRGCCEKKSIKEVKIEKPVRKLPQNQT